MKTKSETAFNGVVILTLALIIVKILSAIYRIPYQNVLGDDGLYAYQQIYPVVALGVILSMNAIPSAVTQVIGVNRPDEVYTRIMFRLQCIGFIVFILLFMFANMITRWMGDSNLAPMLKMAFNRCLRSVKRILSIKASNDHTSNFPGYRTGS